MSAIELKSAEDQAYEVALRERLRPRTAMQVELFGQVVALGLELRDIDAASRRLYRDLRRNPDEPRSEVLARAYRQKANPFAAHERHRRVVQNQYYKLVKLFDPIDPDEVDEKGEPTSVEEDGGPRERIPAIHARDARCERSPVSEGAPRGKPKKAGAARNAKPLANPFNRVCGPISPIRAMKVEKTNPLAAACASVAQVIVQPAGAVGVGGSNAPATSSG